MILKKKGFTLVEVMVVVLIVSITFVGIIGGIISTTNYLTETRQKVMALNLAKEGVEIVYNIRNTNWRRRYEQKDACWLNADPFAHAAWQDSSCSWQAWITPWRWAIATKKQGDSNYYYSLVNHNNSGWSMGVEKKLTLDIDAFTNSIPETTTATYKLNMTWWNRYNSADENNVPWNDPLGWEFYRYIAVDWLYRKDKNNITKISCANWAATIAGSEKCWTPDIAKELRFCSVVVYTRPKQWRIQICSLITNFEE